jgi:hypothetical protein
MEEPESYSILSFLNEDSGLLPIFASISAYLTKKQLFALRTSKGLTERTKTINQEPLYWKERVENWFGITLHDHKVNWKRIYLSLVKEGERLKNESFQIEKKDQMTRMRDKMVRMRDQTIRKKKEELKLKYGKVIPSGDYSPLLIAEDLAAESDNIELVEIILDVLRNETNEQINNEVNYIAENALFWAEYGRGKWNIINFLIDTITDINLKIKILDVSMQSNSDFELTKKLLADPELKDIENYDDILGLAIIYGNKDVVKLLLDEYPVHPEANNNENIIAAARNGNKNIVKLLINDDRVDPTAQDNEAIKRAVERNKWNIVRLLFNDKRVRESLNDPNLIEEIKEALFIE